MSASLSLAESMVSHHRQQLAYWEERLRQANIHDRKPGICRVTGATHVTVTFHSAPPDERRVCVDCKACFPINVDLLTAPHGRSKM